MASKSSMGGSSMTSAKGLCSYKTNPLKQPKRTSSMAGPAIGSPANPDQMKVNKLRDKAYRENDSLRGANGI